MAIDGPPELVLLRLGARGEDDVHVQAARRGVPARGELRHREHRALSEEMMEGKGVEIFIHLWKRADLLYEARGLRATVLTAGHHVHREIGKAAADLVQAGA